MYPISPMMMLLQLHWLPIVKRIAYKTLSLAFQAVESLQIKKGTPLGQKSHPATATTIQVNLWEADFCNSCPKTVELSPRMTQNDT